MPKHVAMFLAWLALAAGCGAAPAATSDPTSTASDASRRARPILARYGLGGISLRVSDAALRPRERASSVAFERALALALESFLVDRSRTLGAGDRAARGGPRATCGGRAPVAAVVCAMNRDGSYLGLASASSAAIPAAARTGDVAYAFALRVPALADSTFWIAVLEEPTGDAVALPVRDSRPRASPRRRAQPARRAATPDARAELDERGTETRSPHGRHEGSPIFVWHARCNRQSSRRSAAEAR